MELLTIPFKSLRLDILCVCALCLRSQTFTISSSCLLSMYKYRKRNHQAARCHVMSGRLKVNTWEVLPKEECQGLSLQCLLKKIKFVNAAYWVHSIQNVNYNGRNFYVVSTISLPSFCLTLHTGSDQILEMAGKEAVCIMT